MWCLSCCPVPVVAVKLFYKNPSLSAHSNSSKLPIMSLSLALQPHFRQLSSGRSPGCLAPRCQSGPGVPFLPITPLVRHVWPTGSCQNITPHLHWRPTFPPISIPSAADGWRICYSDCKLPGTELFKCATSLMSVNYCLGWTLIMNYEQLLGQWGSIVIRERVSQAERLESNHVWQQDPLGCHSVADSALWWLCGGEVSKMTRFFLS